MRLLSPVDQILPCWVAFARVVDVGRKGGEARSMHDPDLKTPGVRWVYRNPLTAVQQAPRGETSGSGSTGSLERENGKKWGVERGDNEFGPLQYSHMGMLASLPNGSLAAAWQVRVSSYPLEPNGTRSPTASWYLKEPKTVSSWYAREPNIALFCYPGNP